MAMATRPQSDLLASTFSRTGPGTIHVLPADDLVEHKVTGLTCVCGPTAELRCCTWLVTHQALDGRE